MFTGIVEELGTVERIIPSGNTLQLTIQAKEILSDVHLGDSIAINGVCLTVTQFTPTSFTVDVMPETFQATSLSLLTIGTKVNLERAMSANGRFGGHFVTGHVDGVGFITSKERQENAIYLTISLPEMGTTFVIDRGSIAIDGISLTVFNVTEQSVTVSLIPHTADVTILGSKMIGDKVNIEFDMLAKYVYKALGKATDDSSNQSNITLDYLKENGFA